MYPCEYVGRRIFYRSDVKRTKKRSAVNVFLEKEGEPCLSTDRLSLCPLEEISEIAKTESKDRDGKFRGWAKITAAKASEDMRDVKDSPTNGNKYHADILLPEDALTDRMKQTWHAKRMALAAEFRPPAEVSSHLQQP